MGSSIEKNIINLLAFLTVYGNASLIKTGSPLIFHISMLLCFLLYCSTSLVRDFLANLNQTTKNIMITITICQDPISIIFI